MLNLPFTLDFTSSLRPLTESGISTLGSESWLPSMQMYIVSSAVIAIGTQSEASGTRSCTTFGVGMRIVCPSILKLSIAVIRCQDADCRYQALGWDCQTTPAQIQPDPSRQHESERILHNVEHHATIGNPTGDDLPRRGCLPSSS